MTTPSEAALAKAREVLPCWAAFSVRPCGICARCELHQRVALALDEFARETPAAKWEADHQRTVLERHGLAEEFPFGCDAIDAVAEALLAARAKAARLP